MRRNRGALALMVLIIIGAVIFFAANQWSSSYNSAHKALIAIAESPYTAAQEKFDVPLEVGRTYNVEISTYYAQTDGYGSLLKNISTVRGTVERSDTTGIGVWKHLSIKTPKEILGICWHDEARTGTIHSGYDCSSTPHPPHMLFIGSGYECWPDVTQFKTTWTSINTLVIGFDLNCPNGKVIGGWEVTFLPADLKW